MSIVTRIKSAWSLLPANVQLAVHGAGSAAVGGAFTAAVAYFSDHDHHTIAALKESVGFIAAGAVGAVALYFKISPMPGWKWDRAVEKGEAIERRASPEVMPPPVVVLPETPPGDPLSTSVPPISPLVDALRERRDPFKPTRRDEK